MRKSLLAALIWLLLVSPIINIWGQDISIMFSVINPEESATGDTVPYLNIKYANNSSVDYYFPALFRTDNTIPLFSSFYGIRKTKESVLSLLHLFSGDKYVLYLNSLTYNSQNFIDLVPDNNEEITEPQPINDYLNLFYSLQDSNTSETPSIKFFTKSQLRCAHYIRANKSFVFLKAGESFSQLIDLRGFLETGIIIRVALNFDKPTHYMRTGWNKSSDLPDKVDSFALYQGYIENNSILIDFTDSQIINVQQIK